MKVMKIRSMMMKTTNFPKKMELLMKHLKLQSWKMNSAPSVEKRTMRSDIRRFRLQQRPLLQCIRAKYVIIDIHV